MLFSLSPAHWLVLFVAVSLVSAGVNRHQTHHRRRHHRGETPSNRHHSRSGSEAKMQRDATQDIVAEIPPGATMADNETLQQYVQSNCSTCIWREEAKRARINQIKDDLLQKLGFDQKTIPRANASRDIPPFDNDGPFYGLLQRYGYQNDSPGGVFNLNLQQQDVVARTERIYSFARNPPSGTATSMEGRPVAYFNFSSETTKRNIVQEARLNVYIRRPTTEINTVITELKIEIYEIRKQKGKGAKGDRYYVEMVPNKTKKVKLPLNRGVWQTFDLKGLVQQWFSKEDSNNGIFVNCTFLGENLAVHPTDDDSSHNMYLNILTEEGERSKRTRRNAMNIDCKEADNETRCCRYPLVIDFEEFKWDFVIAPKKYMAYYCSGACPFKYLERYVHTHLVHQSIPDGSSGPCCYPTEMAPIMMVYLNNNKEVLVSQVPGMVATRCGCA